MKKRNSKTIVTDYDKLILILYLSLMAIGLLVMLDISSVRNSMMYFYRQLAYFGIAIIMILCVFFYVNVDKLRRWISVFIILTIGLLVYVLINGESVKGATRSINFGVVNFQPSFLARIVLIFFFAHVIDRKKQELAQANLKEFIKLFLPLLFITALIYGLILKGQHLSSLIISASSLVCLLFLGGIRFRIILLAITISIAAGFAIIKMGAGYRSERLDIYKKYCLFFKSDTTKASHTKEYQVKESLTALTSGKFFGTGADRGRAKHYYLPEARTDYVFTIIGEEFGFLGAILVFGLHCLLFFRIMLMAFKQTDFYLQLVAMGLALNIFLNVLVNVGVSMSILPSTGNTLPFISYSGTAILIDSLSIGIILNISAKRKVI
jgi:cell division protein FtsW (lipid II flippase)